MKKRSKWKEIAEGELWKRVVLFSFLKERGNERKKKERNGKVWKKKETEKGRGRKKKRGRKS